MAAQKEPTPQQLFPLAGSNAKLKITVQVKRPTFESGQIIGNGKFVVRKTINEGGFGVVYQVSLVNVGQLCYSSTILYFRNLARIMHSSWP